MLKCEPDLAVNLAWIRVQAIHVDASLTAFERLQHCAESYRQKYGQTPIGEIQGVRWARELFHAIGIDPTKRRPSSEALLHRALKGKDLYSVNSLVDVGNWCSLDFLLPICVYDAQKISGEIHVRKGRAEDSYLAISGQELHLSGRYVLADEIGAFGSPITDSQRTMVDFATHEALLIIFAPQSYDRNLLYQQAKIFAERTTEICGGSIAEISQRFM